ncbi:MAG: ATP-binding protein [Parcubacteria group bacterium]|jgi:hypothetical protein
MDKNILQQIILDQRGSFEKQKKVVLRKFPEDLIRNKKITVISGVRRSGKSTLLKELAARYENYYYFNFEDERLLDFSAADFNVLYELFLSMYGEQKTIFFDEIQNIFGWEKFVRRLFEEGYKIFVTGSNAKLLSSELATSLTGRYLKIELFPFSFGEYLVFNGFLPKKVYTTNEKAKLVNYLKKYFDYGGFPEVVLSQSEEELKQLYQDILIKDLIVRFKIKDGKSFRELALFLLSNSGTKISYNNLKKILNFKSVTTVKKYVELLESAYLNFTISKFDYSLKKQIVNDKKVYSIDTGLISHVAFSFSENRGRVLENNVFLELKRRDEEVYYDFGKKEVDFLLKKGRIITMAIQVTTELNKENRERELAGLTEAMQKYDLKEGFVITMDQEENIKNKTGVIRIIPVWKWLLV